MKQVQVIYISVVLGSLVLSIGLQMLLPFPYGLIMAIGIFIALPQILGRIMKNKLKDLGFSTMGPPKAQKTCLVCGRKSNKAQCSRCGSKQFGYK
jgi:hypothetical protein